VDVSHLAFLFVCVTWGASFILMERATHAFGPVAVAIGRLASGAAVLAVVWWAQRARYRVAWRDMGRIGGVALVGTALPFAVQPYCLSRGFGHSYFGMMVGLTPLATIVVSVPMLRIWPTWRQLIGVVGGFLCMLLLVREGSQRGMSVGILALAVSVPVCYGFGNTYVKWRLAHVHAVPLTALLLALAAGWLVPLELVPGGLARLGLGGPPEPHGWPMAIGSLTVLGVLGTGVAVLLVINLIVKEGPLFAGMVTYVVPTLALLWGAVDGEVITLRQIAAIGGVLAMVALVQFGGKREADDRARRREVEPHFVPSENPVLELPGEPGGDSVSTWEA
jgi:drug/metabolite transporter (DMT)-like permease